MGNCGITGQPKYDKGATQIHRYNYGHYCCDECISDVAIERLIWPLRLFRISVFGFWSVGQLAVGWMSCRVVELSSCRANPLALVVDSFIGQFLLKSIYISGS